MRAFLSAVLFLTLVCPFVAAFAPPGAPAHIHDRFKAVEAAHHIASSAALHAAQNVGTITHAAAAAAAAAASSKNVANGLKMRGDVPALVEQVPAAVNAAVGQVASSLASSVPRAATSSAAKVDAAAARARRAVENDIQAQKRECAARQTRRNVGRSKRFTVQRRAASDPSTAAVVS